MGPIVAAARFEPPIGWNSVSSRGWDGLCICMWLGWWMFLIAPVVAVFSVVIVVFAVAVQLVVRPWCARARAQDTGKCVLETTKLDCHWFYIIVKIKTHDQQI